MIGRKDAALELKLWRDGAATTRNAKGVAGWPPLS
jgi:hypothetical protein